MKGIVVVNPYKIPESSLKQANRLIKEFADLGVEVKIAYDCFVLFNVEEDKIISKLEGIDFAVFLDKDKYLSSILTKIGVKLFNSHQAIRKCDDKGETCLELINSGVKMPKTMFAPLCFNKDVKIDFDYVNTIIQNLSLPIIVKESFGSMGYGVHKADTREELIELEKKLKLIPHIYQEYVGSKKGTDVRVIVIGKKAFAWMERVNEQDFRSNIGHGGKGKKIDLPNEFCLTAQRCAEVLDLDYCGVDLLYDKDNNPVVCEVNSNAFFDEIEKITGKNVAREYAKYIVQNLR